MEHTENLNVRLVPSLEAAIDRWLAARRAYKKQGSDENRDAYNATYFALGAAWAERHPETANSSDAFEWFWRGLIAPEEE